MDQYLHQRAPDVADELLAHTKSKPTAYLVAVLWHDIPKPVTNVARDSFMFVKCVGKTTLAKISDAYLLREEAPSEVSLHMDSIVPPATTKVSDYDHFGDKVIVFQARAVDPVDTTSRISDATNGMTLSRDSMPFKSSPAPIFEQHRVGATGNTLSAAQFTGAQTPVRQHSSSSRPSVDRSGLRAASSERAPSSSSRSGYTPNSQVASPLAKSAPVPSTPGTELPPQVPISTQDRDLGSARFAQNPGLPFSYAFSPRAQTSLASQIRGSPQTPRAGTTHNKTHQGQPNGNGLAATATHPDSTRPTIKTEISLPAPLPLQPFEDHKMGNAGSLPSGEDYDDEPIQYVQSSVYLQALAKEESTEKLEAGVEQGIKLLDRFVKELEPGKETADIQQWLQQIDLVRKEATGARTVVGVVGNTGAGKSSVINAILDEERLVPTNCMRACTAVVTEMSWNASADENSRYRAEIEFIKPAEWEKELQVLFEEIIDGSGNISREVSNPDSQAGIAYAKIRAVYWRLTREDLVASSIEKLMTDHSVRGLLGTIKYVKDRHCDTFYKTLQHYVDSKEKPETTKESDEEAEGDTEVDKDKKKKKSRKREQEFWPLIKVVRLFVKADALSTGAVLVDLPGVADSNAARAAVAEGYMKQCTGLWIFSPINRAVDDKAAKNLLGSTFRRQLKYDGTYSAVTFICSKTDDISNTEAADSLGLGDEIDKLEDQLTSIDNQRRRAEREAAKLRDEKGSLREIMDNCDDEIEKWEALQEKLSDGDTVYAPASKTRKRKRSSSSTDSEDENEKGDPSDNESQSSDRGSPLTAEDIETKIQELKDQKKIARRGRSEIEAQVKELNVKIKECKAEARSIEDSRSQICIDARNQYSKSAIQVDFAAGIKELDQEAQAEDDPDTFDPEQDMRDYEKVAKDLPVFCVSSRAYQKLSGRLVKDNAVRGFTDVDQTEIPALKAHCKKLTENVRFIKSRRFLTQLSQLRTSLALWASNDGSGAKKTDQQKDAEQRFLARKLKELEKALEKDVNDTLTEMKETMSENVFGNYGTAITAAANAALPTSQGWGAHRNQGGLYWATYKAVVRRQGVFTGSGGLSDFNAQLTEPIYKQLANGWEKAFQRRLPHILRACAKGFANDLRAFHKAIEVQSFSHGGNPRLGLLAQQLTNYEAVFSDLGSKMVELLNERQRDINREFTPNVCNAMLIVYNICTAEAGPGQYNRMKTHMTNHVTAQKDTMFQRATQVVRDMITNLIKDIEEQMANRTDEVFVGMRRDYLQVLSNVRVDDIIMPKWERSLRSTIEEIIQDSEAAFAAVIEGRDTNGSEADEATEGAPEDEQNIAKLENMDDIPEDRAQIKEDTSDDAANMEGAHA
ncbi:hypothetical protein E4T43_02175 [Aureobasidium subglaciale]|nr:hypothetical protein E4T43_02175 [Aureobasidium subglaciale]